TLPTCGFKRQSKLFSVPCGQFIILSRMPLDLPSGSLRNRLKIRDPHRGLYRITSERRIRIVRCARSLEAGVVQSDIHAVANLAVLLELAHLRAEQAGDIAALALSQAVRGLEERAVVSSAGLAVAELELLLERGTQTVVERTGDLCVTNVQNSHVSLLLSQLPSGALSSVPDSTGSIQIGGLIFRSSSSSVVLTS